MNLGVSDQTSQAFLGDGYRVFSRVDDPIFPVCIFSHDSENLSGPKSHIRDFSEYVFQEVSYEAVTGIRRGFIWRMSGSSQPSCWRGVSNLDNGSSYFTFGIQKLMGVLARGPAGAFLTFGSGADYSVGDIVQYETQIDGRELLTVQMRKQFSYLPEIDWDVVDAEATDISRLKGAVAKVKEGYRRSPAESVVDRCREAFTVIMQLCVSHAPGEDLGKLVKRYEEEKGRSTISSNAYSIARMHGRTKAAEYQKGFPVLHHRDADMAVLMLGSSLVALCWASW